MANFSIVETDNFGGDYPNESRLKLPLMSEEAASAIAAEINKHCSGDHHPRYWQVKPEDYKLQPGFES